MLDNEKQANIDLLNDELLKLEFLLRYGNYPYIFAVSNKQYIRDYFEQMLGAMTDVIIPLNNYELKTVKWLEDLRKNNILLLNIIEHEQKLEKEAQEKNSFFASSPFYYSLVIPREMIIKTKHGLVMVCDEKLILKILTNNQSVASCSYITFLDDALKIKLEESNTNLKQYAKKIANKKAYEER